MTTIAINSTSSNTKATPFVGKNDNGTLFQGYALIVAGYWALRPSGSHIWALSEGNALGLTGKVAQGTDTVPKCFSKWGALESQSQVSPVSPVAPVASPPSTAPQGPFGRAQAPVAPVAPKTGRSLAQITHTLRLMVLNGEARLEGRQGGDLTKGRKAVATALSHYREAGGNEAGLILQAQTVIAGHTALIEPGHGEEPVVQAPVVQAPVVQAPVVQAPVVQAPVVQAPVAPDIAAQLAGLQAQIAALTGIIAGLVPAVAALATAQAAALAPAPSPSPSPAPAPEAQADEAQAGEAQAGEAAAA
jgi:hypothetical protein